MRNDDLVFLFGLAFGLLFGIQGGLLISMVFDKWSQSAAKWIMRRWFT
jgi:hypothetical protein